MTGVGDQLFPDQSIRVVAWPLNVKPHGGKQVCAITRRLVRLENESQNRGTNAPVLSNELMILSFSPMFPHHRTYSSFRNFVDIAFTINFDHPAHRREFTRKSTTIYFTESNSLMIAFVSTGYDNKPSRRRANLSHPLGARLTVHEQRG